MPKPFRHPCRSQRAFTLLEVIIALALIAVLFSILLPALSSARVASHRDHCADNLRIIGEAWQSYLAEHEKTFPYVAPQPAWQYGGMRFSGMDRTALPDFNRPLTSYLHLFRTRDYGEVCTCCPADRGITTADAVAAGTGERTAFESYGTSYRANALLMDARSAGLTDESRGMKRSEIRAFPAALVLSGDAVWYEAAESTGRHADWHGVPNAGNILFLDGSVRFMTVSPKGVRGPIMFDPQAIRELPAAGPESQPQSPPQTQPEPPPEERQSPMRTSPSS